MSLQKGNRILVSSCEEEICVVKHFCDVCKKEAITKPVSLPVLVQRGLNHFNEPNFEITTQQFDICDSCLKEIAKEVSKKTGIMGTGDE